MLTQTWANPAQNIGRVKIIIAEGIHYGQGISGFEKKRNLVCFSFQHAPQSELQFWDPKLPVLIPKQIFSRVVV